MVWIQHSDEHLARGSEGWQIVPELTPGGAEPLVEKSYGDAFETGASLYLTYQTAPGRTAGVTTTSDVDFRATS